MLATLLPLLQQYSKYKSFYYFEAQIQKNQPQKYSIKLAYIFVLLNFASEDLPDQVC